MVVNTEAADDAKKQLLEEQKVEASPEYEAATDIYNSTYGGFVGSFVFGLVFLIVLTQQLDRKIDASWWAVFTPLWIYFGSRWIYSFLGCMCGAVTGEEVIIQMQQQQQQQEQEDGDGDDDNVEDGEKKDKDKKEDKRDDSNFLNPEMNVSDFLASESERKEKEDDRPDDEKDADKKQTEGKQQEEEKKKGKQERAAKIRARKEKTDIGDPLYVGAETTTRMGDIDMDEVEYVVNLEDEEGSGTNDLQADAERAERLERRVRTRKRTCRE